MKYISALILKYPIKTMITTMIVLAGLFFGVTKISLNTGNDTLISDQTDLYQDNYDYQMAFGKDPIILIFDQVSLYDQTTLSLMHQIHKDVADMPGIYAMNSPVTLINQISSTMYVQTELGLEQMSMGLMNVSNQLSTLSMEIQNNQPAIVDFEALNNNLNELIDAQEQLGFGLVNIFNIVAMLENSVDELEADITTLKSDLDETMTEELALVDNMLLETSQLKASLTSITNQSNLTQIPVTTSGTLSQILLTLVELSSVIYQQQTSMSTLATALSTMGTNLYQMGVSLSVIQQNFNAFEPGFPTSQDTLDRMIYEDGVVKDMFKGFIVEEKLRMVLVLNGDVTDKQIDAINNQINQTLFEQNASEEVLVSGKPILDRSIKLSMMDSMQYMMIFAVFAMVIILLLTYPVKMRWLPIVMILFAVVVTVGIMGWLNIGLTMVSMAVFPVLIGLGIDYFIQFQSRYEIERSES
ncbi:MMPL family transporter [Paracholeplasma manati]|uniref:MMPL family transporter n=1 Tax=Paracholeplasma manati TaxID=591373 RepID=UPI002407BED2|nr:MMPL family transporter [Paracholeplasma manati]MDG0888306.1 MMPL family transporter [Paracholeplasma manati]